MDAVHIHLFLNHIPIVGALASVLLLAYATIRKSDEVLRVGFMALVLTALVTIPVYLTGEPAEEVAEKLPGVTDAFIEEHEDAGKLAMIAAVLTGVVALASLLFARRSDKVGQTLTWVTILLSVVTTGAMVRTGGLGGQIRHTEIRSAGTAGAPASRDAERRKESHDDN
jgi:formate hydrogenlyase subunit 3/multisubunit Na+/H+ antiporter MnhD subunit